MTSSEQFWRRVRRFSPILCRLLARHRYGPPLSTEEIVRRSGLSALIVAALSEAIDWTGVDLETFRRFTQACGVDPTNAQEMRRIESYLSKRPVRFKYLKKSPQWETLYKPLMLRWQQSIALGPTPN